MTRITKVIAILAPIWLLFACGDGGPRSEEPVVTGAATDVTSDALEAAPETTPPAVTFKPGRETRSPGKPSGPVSIAYKIVGSPVVGQPLAIELRISSTLGAQPIELSYRINDASALQLAESQPGFASVAPTADRPERTQQVLVVPLRQGRVFLNVAATVQGQDGSMSTVTAVPIEVGNAPRKIEQQGRVETDEAGESVRVLTGKDD